MTLKTTCGPIYTRTERYEETLATATEELVARHEAAGEGDIVHDAVVLVWTRERDGSWVRCTHGHQGSRVTGYIKPVGQRRGHRFTYREVFERQTGELKPQFAEVFPDLQKLILEIEEHDLPK